MAPQLPGKLTGLILIGYCIIQSYRLFGVEVSISEEQMFYGVIYAVCGAGITIGLARVVDKDRIRNSDIKIRKAANRQWSYLAVLAMFAGIITAAAGI